MDICEEHCPWGNQDQVYCVNYRCIDDLTKDFTISGNSLLFCHINAVSLPKNIEKIEDFFDQLPKKT